jgi:hypothetical protein
MKSPNQTSTILLALDKALIDNQLDLTEQDRKSLACAVFKTIIEEPVAAPIEGETANADIHPDHRRD